MIEWFALDFDMIDMIGTLGFGVGLIIAIWLRENTRESPFVWAPFVLVAIVFALFAGEGGLLDPFGPYTLRTAALVILLVAEIVGGWLAIRPPSSNSQH